MSQEQTVRGVGRLHCGQRTLGWVGYVLQMASTGQCALVKFDPVPDSTRGDVFQLSLEDGRVLDCQPINGEQYWAVVGDGPRIERRQHRRPYPSARALS